MIMVKKAKIKRESTRENEMESKLLLDLNTTNKKVHSSPTGSETPLSTLVHTPLDTSKTTNPERNKWILTYSLNGCDSYAFALFAFELSMS